MKRLGVGTAAMVLAVTAIGGGAAGAGRQSEVFHGRWLNVTDYCGSVALEEAPVPARGVWNLVLGGSDRGRFTFEYRDVRGVKVAGEVAVTVVDRDPLTVTGEFLHAADGFAMTMTIDGDDAVLSARTNTVCDESGNVIAPTFVGTVR